MSERDHLERDLADAERAWFTANGEIRSYDGPIKMPDGRPHPQWTALLDNADAAAKAVTYLKDRMRHGSRCPFCFQEMPPIQKAKAVS